MPTLAQLMMEASRLRLLRGLDELVGRLGFTRVAGVDEAGRGSLAGPVVAAAVIPDPGVAIPGVDDSKAVPAPRRERLAARIRETALSFAVVPVSPDLIDRLNILEATRRAMRQALASLEPPPDCALVDAVSLPGERFPSFSLVRGDALSFAIACASILAKVERDRMMLELDCEYPHYGFARHKGYAAAEHRRALERFGPSPAHRLTFRSVLPRTQEARP